MKSPNLEMLNSNFIAQKVYENITVAPIIQTSGKRLKFQSHKVQYEWRSKYSEYLEF